MNPLPRPTLAVTGAAMDAVVPPSKRRRHVLIAGAAALLALMLLGYFWLVPYGLQVPLGQVRIGTVQSGVFQDQLILRAAAMPVNSVILDAVESGRVEEIMVRDGAQVKAGQVLFRLSNPQRRLELLARQSDHAQQISNLSNLRVVLESTRTEHQRRMADIEFEIGEARKTHERNVSLSQQSFVSRNALADSNDRLARFQRQRVDEKRSIEAELAIKVDAIRQMERAIKTLDSGLSLMESTIDALSVRAPIAGRLADFYLQIGQAVKQDQHIGRIDDPSSFKLQADVDEFYLNRMQAGRAATLQAGAAPYPLKVARIFPQVKEGRFKIELEFDGAQPAGLSPGQTLDATVTLGEPANALLLPNGAYVNDTGGAWVYAIANDGVKVTRRPVKLGRRSTSQVEILSGLAAGEKVIISSYAHYGQAERLQLLK